MPSNPQPTSKREAVTAVILCGGRGTRLGGVDKPLLDLAGRPLLGHLVERLQPQVDQIVLSCSRSTAEYERFGYPLVADVQADQGPLGGIVSAAAKIATPWLLTIPGDMPFVPANLIAALASHCRSRGAAVATAAGYRQNLTMLLAPPSIESLRGFFVAGGRAAHRWLDANAVAAVEFAGADFLNVNTVADLRLARSRLCIDADRPA